MNIKTEQFGEIEIDNTNIIKITGGILGFEKHEDYVLVPFNEDNPLSFLQSVDRSTLAFIVVNPMEFFVDYEPDVPDADLKDIKITNPEQAVLVSLVSIPEKVEDMTVNLIAPIVINKDTKTGKQIVLQDQGFGTKHRLIIEGQAAC